MVTNHLLTGMILQVPGFIPLVRYTQLITGIFHRGKNTGVKHHIYNGPLGAQLGNPKDS